MSLVEAVGLARLVRVWEGCECDWMPVGVVCVGGEDSYNVPDDVVCSLPARCVNGEWVVVRGIPLKDEIKVCCLLKVLTFYSFTAILLFYRRVCQSKCPYSRLNLIRQ